MKRPVMILFDYGQTLISETKYDGVKGTMAVMKYATENPHNYTAEQIQAEAEEVFREIGWGDFSKRHLQITEVHNQIFNRYLYESLGIKIDLPQEKFDKIFWDNSAPGKPTEGIGDFLTFLKAEGIRTGVISNISFCGEAVVERINRLVPENDFEFIIPSSEYLFRKPNVRLFKLALEKAGLDAEDVWYIGDNYYCDIEGARNTGMFPVWYKGAAFNEYPDVEGVLSVHSWEEVKDIISKITKGD